MARNSSPNPTEESNSVFYETEDRNNIQALIRPRSPASTDDDQPPPKPTCLSQLDGWNDHGDDPEKAINIHLSHTGEVEGLTEAPEATGGTIVCFDHHDDVSSKNLQGTDDNSINTVKSFCSHAARNDQILDASTNNFLIESEKKPRMNTEQALDALRVKKNVTSSLSKPSTCNNVVDPSSSKLAANTKETEKQENQPDKLPAKDMENEKMSKTSTEDDKTPKKRPTKDNTQHEQAIEMGKTFKNVAKTIVEMAGVEFKDQERQVDVDIQKDLDTIKFSDANSEGFNRKAFGALLKKIEKRQNKLSESSKKIYAKYQQMYQTYLKFHEFTAKDEMSLSNFFFLMLYHYSATTLWTMYSAI